MIFLKHPLETKGFAIAKTGVYSCQKLYIFCLNGPPIFDSVRSLFIFPRISQTSNLVLFPNNPIFDKKCLITIRNRDI